MVIGTVKEIKNNEFRVGLTPSCVKSYSLNGHTILVEKGAGEESGFPDEEYRNSGAEIISSAAEVWSSSDMLVKVKEPIKSEYDYLRKNQILYTYLHLAADRPLTDALLKKRVKAVAYETITGRNGGLPCLLPMSAIAGRLSIQEGAKYLEKPFGGRGMLLGGVPGVKRSNVVIIGGGVVGLNACKMAVGLGANVTVLDVNNEKLSYFDDLFGSTVTTLYSTRANIQDAITQAELVVGAVLLPGKAAPKLIYKEDIQTMKKGAVIVDVAVDQGGCFETSRATTHQDPIFIIEDVIHYCVANMPGAVSRTSTIALTNATLSYGLAIAAEGLEKSSVSNPGLLAGINCYEGNCTCKGVAETFDLEYVNPLDVLSN